MIADARAWGWSWVGLTVAFVIHIADEVASDALAFYNPTIRVVTGTDLTFNIWLTILTLLVVGLVSLSPFVFRGVKGLKYPVYVVATLMILNSLQHLVLFVSLQRITPGTRSAPVLFAASVWVLRETRRVFSRG